VIVDWEDEGDATPWDGVGAGINNNEIFKARNCFFDIKNVARTVAQQAPPLVGDRGCAGSWWHDEHLSTRHFTSFI
jgi:hypothetical protein